MSVRVDVTEVPPDAPSIPPDAVSAWEALAERCPEASPYATLDVAEAVRLGYGRSYRIALARDGGELVGALVAFWSRRGPFSLCVMPPYVAYLPLLLPQRVRDDHAATHARRDVLTALVRAATEGSDRVAIHLPPEIADVRGPAWAGFSTSPLYTYTLPLATEPGAFMRNASKRVRRAVRNEASEYDLRIVPSAERTAMLMAKSYARAGRRAPDSLPLAEHLAARGRLLVLEAWRDGACEAATAFVLGNARAGALLAGGRTGSAMQILTAHASPLLHARAARGLDLAGANTPSIAEFKRRFGSALVPYFRLTCTPSRVLRALEAAGRPVG